MKTIELVYVTFIRTTPKELWAAITKPEFTRQYWGGCANMSDWKKGSQWRHAMADKPDDVWVAGKVLESKPPKRLVLTWTDPDDPKDHASRVTYEIEKVEDMVSLRVTHSEIKAGSERAKNVSWGWPRVISSLKTFLETGKGLNIFAGTK